MPAAISLCTGASRLVPVKRFTKDDKVDCPGCALKVKSRPVRHGSDLYYETPSHRPQGTRDPGKIDWSQV